jgi:peptidoglycan/xylan/chitin deacetylase (PgdA/CDA1 family)
MRAILTYHSIDSSGSPISVAPDAFARHVVWLASGRVSVEPLAAIVQGGDCAADGRDRVALTFDDAFENFGTVAWPRLRASGLPATVFVVSEHVGGTNRWDGVPAPGIPELPLLSWDALGACAAAGADIGAHSRTHPHLPDLPAAARQDELATATRLSRATPRPSSRGRARPSTGRSAAAIPCISCRGSTCSTFRRRARSTTGDVRRFCAESRCGAPRARCGSGGAAAGTVARRLPKAYHEDEGGTRGRQPLESN